MSVSARASIILQPGVLGKQNLFIKLAFLPGLPDTPRICSPLRVKYQASPRVFFLSSAASPPAYGDSGFTSSHGICHAYRTLLALYRGTWLLP